MKNSRRLVIWPANIDNRKSRRNGRRIPKPVAIESPRIIELYKAAEQLSLNPELHKDAALPISWWDKTGYLIVDKKKTRKSTLNKIVNEIRNKRKSFSIKKN